MRADFPSGYLILIVEGRHRNTPVRLPSRDPRPVTWLPQAEGGYKATFLFGTAEQAGKRGPQGIKPLLGDYEITAFGGRGGVEIEVPPGLVVDEARSRFFPAPDAGFGVSRVVLVPAR